jgi:hypothetical protein
MPGRPEEPGSKGGHLSAGFPPEASGGYGCNAVNDGAGHLSGAPDRHGELYEADLAELPSDAGLVD